MERIPDTLPSKSPQSLESSTTASESAEESKCLEGGPAAARAGQRLLGGSWVVISRVISRVTILITHIRGLITLLITTPEPPSSGVFKDFGLSAKSPAPAH